MIEIYISKNASDAVRKGFPWVYKSEITYNSTLDFIESGQIVKILDNKGKFLANGYFNYNSIISVRLLNQKSDEKIDELFFKSRIQNAIKKREKLFNNRKNFNPNFCRIIFGEADFLAGFILDKYNNYLSCEITTQGAFKLKDYFIKAVLEFFKPEGFVISFNPSDKSEQLSKEKIIIGDIPEIIEIYENEVFYYANLREGQKTGWFYDQRENRNFLTKFASDNNFLDLFSHTGGFGILAGYRGAKNVFIVDSSELAINLAKLAAKKNNILEKCNFIKQDAFDFLAEYNPQENLYFDIISADPPAFIKSKKYIESGMKGYKKLADGCLKFLNKSDNHKKYFALTSCSHHAERQKLKNIIEKSISEHLFNREERNIANANSLVNAEIDGVNNAEKFIYSQNKKRYNTSGYDLIASFGADKDHTPHPSLAKTDYLKFLCWGG